MYLCFFSSLIVKWWEKSAVWQVWKSSSSSFEWFNVSEFRENVNRDSQEQQRGETERKNLGKRTKMGKRKEVK